MSCAIEMVKTYGLLLEEQEQLRHELHALRQEKHTLLHEASQQKLLMEDAEKARVRDTELIKSLRATIASYVHASTLVNTIDDVVTVTCSRAGQVDAEPAAQIQAMEQRLEMKEAEIAAMRPNAVACEWRARLRGSLMLRVFPNERVSAYCV